GDITAWTESKLQHHNWLGWSATSSTEICVNTGVNDMWFDIIGATANGQEYYLAESKDPLKRCTPGASSYERGTTHARLVSPYGYLLNWKLNARGCGSAVVNGITLGICAPTHQITWWTS